MKIVITDLFRKIRYLTPLMLMLLTACATDRVTGRSSYNLYSMNQDVQMGKTFMADIGKQMHKEGVEKVSSGKQYHAINRMVEDISRVCHWSNLPYRVTIYNTNVVNAAALPGGEMMVFTGLYSGSNALCRTKDELAAVIAHEMAHVNCRHSTEQLSNTLTAGALVEVAAIALEADDKSDTANIIRGAFLVGSLVVIPVYSRAHEREADRIGLKYMAMAGYDPRAAVRLWRKAAEQEEKRKTSKVLGGIVSIFSTHPPSRERAQYLEESLPEAIMLYEQAIADKKK